MIVADAGPVHYLILIERIKLLYDFHGTVIVPSAVLSELSQRETPPSVSRWIGAPPP